MLNFGRTMSIPESMDCRYVFKGYLEVKINLGCLLTSDEPVPSWLEPGLELNNFQLGSARDLFLPAREFLY